MGAIKGVPQRVAEATTEAIEGLVGGDPAPAAPQDAARKREAAKPKAPTQARAATTSSAPALSIEELIANSIAQKESVIGRELSADEKADMTAKVKKLMGA